MTIARCAAILLASGLSSRFDGASKLSTPLDGQPLAAWAMAPLAGLGFAERHIVVGPQTPGEIAALAADSGFAIRLNPTPERGLGAALALAMVGLGPVERVFVALADMPFVRRTDYRLLDAALDADPAKSLAAPLHDGQRGHPVLFAAPHFAALRGLEGDRGAGLLLERHKAELALVATGNAGVLRDIDTRADLAAAEPIARAWKG